MKLKKVLAVSLVAAMTLSMAAYGNREWGRCTGSRRRSELRRHQIGRGLHRHHDNHPCIQPENRYVRGQLSGKELGSLHC